MNLPPFWSNGPPPTWSLIDELDEKHKKPSNAPRSQVREIEGQEEERRRKKREQMEEDSRLARSLQEEEARHTQLSRSYSASSSTTIIQNSHPSRVVTLTPPPLFLGGSRSVLVHEDDDYWLGHRRRGVVSAFGTTPPPTIKFEVVKRFVLSKKSWSWGGELYVRDEEIGEEVFRVKGKLLSVGARLKIMDLRGIEQAYIRQRVSFRTPYYEVWKWNTLALTLKGSKKKQHGGELAGDCYADGSRLVVAGRPKELDYELRRGTGELSHQVARVCSRTLEEYVVQVPAGEDVVLMLAAALIVDRAAMQQPL